MLKGIVTPNQTEKTALYFKLNSHTSDLLMQDNILKKSFKLTAIKRKNEDKKKNAKDNEKVIKFSNLIDILSDEDAYCGYPFLSLSSFHTHSIFFFSFLLFLP